MNVERATGLVLRTRPITETSLIVHWLTPEFGRISTMAKGARRPKSPFRGRLDLFFKADFSFVRSRRSDLHTLREVAVVETHPALREDLHRLEQAAYCALLVEQATEPDTPLPGIYRLIESFLGRIVATKPGLTTVWAFETRLLGELGLGPDLNRGGLNRGTVKAIEYLGAVEMADLDRLGVSNAQADEVSRFLGECLVRNFGRALPARKSALRSG